jgi:hypothetical protein
VVLVVMLAPKIKSLAFVVLTAPLFAVLPVPIAPAVTSTGPVVASPLYSKIRISTYMAATVNLTVTVFAFAADPTIFLA